MGAENHTFLPEPAQASKPGQGDSQRRELRGPSRSLAARAGPPGGALPARLPSTGAGSGGDIAHWVRLLLNLGGCRRCLVHSAPPSPPS